MRSELLVALLAITWTGAVLADEEAAATFRIAIEVTVADEDVKERVTMYFRNELRGLGDVEVTADKPHFRIYAVVSEIRTDRTTRIAYVLGTSVTTFFPKGYFDTILNKSLLNAAEVSARLEEVPVYENQFISTAGPTEANLIETVVNSVARLNAHVLQPRRSTE